MLKNLDIVTAILLIIGGLNWGLVGLFSFNLVTAIFGGTILATIVYVLVALSAVYQIFALKNICKR